MGRAWTLRDARAAMPAMRVPAPCWACAAAAAMLLATPSYGGQDFPPPIVPQSDLDAAQGGRPPASPDTPAVPPSPATKTLAEQPAKPKPQGDVRVEQKRIGRRVAELIVTPAGFTYHYKIIHLDEQDRGTTPLQPHTELSVPRLFEIDF